MSAFAFVGYVLGALGALALFVSVGLVILLRRKIATDPHRVAWLLVDQAPWLHGRWIRLDAVRGQIRVVPPLTAEEAKGDAKPQRPSALAAAEAVLVEAAKVVHRDGNVAHVLAAAKLLEMTEVEVDVEPGSYAELAAEVLLAAHRAGVGGGFEREGEGVPSVPPAAILGLAKQLGTFALVRNQEIAALTEDLGRLVVAASLVSRAYENADHVPGSIVTLEEVARDVRRGKATRPVIAKAGA